MLNASQLARTRGDGEICTKELPHSLAAFSSRNHAGEEGSLSPRHQSGRSRQRRFAMTPSRTATQQGQDPSTACTPRESELLQNTPRRRVSKQAVQCGIKQDFEWRGCAPASALTQCAGRTSVALKAERDGTSKLPGGRRLNPI